MTPTSETKNADSNDRDLRMNLSGTAQGHETETITQVIHHNEYPQNPNPRMRNSNNPWRSSFSAEQTVQKNIWRQ